MKKALTDFIAYSHNNITWFSFNFVLCTMPAMCILIDSDSVGMVKPGADGSYYRILYTLWGLHVIAFICQWVIYSRDPDEVERYHLHSAFDKDDQFKMNNKNNMAINENDGQLVGGEDPTS